MGTTRIDAVGLVRQIRDAQAEEWGGRSTEDVISFFREAAARLRAQSLSATATRQPEASIDSASSEAAPKRKT